MSQALSLGADLSGANWGLARVIRRQPPWSTVRMGLPITTFFESERDGTGVDIYFIDSGIRTSHDEFGSRATNVYEAVSSGGLGDDNGHGTATASIACGATVGVARGAEIFSFKALDASNAISTTNWNSAIAEIMDHYASRAGTNRPAVVNASLFSGAGISMGQFIDVGMVCVACVANDGADLATVAVNPAESDADVIAVGGIGAYDIPYYTSGAGRSNWGTRIDVSGPAQSLWAATNSGDSAYQLRSGTSFSTALVAGIVACMLQGHGRLTGADAAARRAKVVAVKDKLMSNATTGRLVNPAGWGITLPDRLLYLDPNQAAPEPISGL